MSENQKFYLDKKKFGSEASKKKGGTFQKFPNGISISYILMSVKRLAKQAEYF